MVEDGYMKTEIEGEIMIKGYALYAGRSKEGVTSCNAKE
jgi:hypothetical protein